LDEAIESSDNKDVEMKCPHCHMEDVSISPAPKLRLLSFVFTTIRCPRCSGVYAIPDNGTSGGDNNPKPGHHRQRQQFAA